MADLTRKNFLTLTTSAAVAAAATLAPPRNAAARAEPAPKGPPRPTLIRGADLLTMDPKLKEMGGVDVLIVDGKIAAIGKGLVHPGAEVMEAHGMILMPGMIDGHRHVWEGLQSGHLVKTRPHGINGYDKYQDLKERAIVTMTPEDQYLANYLGGVLALDAGVTSVFNYAHGQNTAETAFGAARGFKDSGVGGWFGYAPYVSSSYKAGDTPPLQLAVCPDADMEYPLEYIRKGMTRIRNMGVKMMSIHIVKPDHPSKEGQMGFRDSGMADLHDAGLLGPDLQVVHANQLTDDELKILADTGGMICTTTVGEFPYMNNPLMGAPVHGRARAAGVAVGIGVDVPGSLTQDYFEHCRAAYWGLFLSKEGAKISESYDSSDTLDFATSLGARGVRLGDTVGSITVGKRADLVLVRTDRFGFALLGSLADRILNFAALQDIDSVWVAGVVRKRHGQLVGVDLVKLKTQQAAAQARLAPLEASITFTGPGVTKATALPPKF